MEADEIGRASFKLKNAANGILRAMAEGGDRLPYFCECDDLDCLRALWLSPLEYDRRRARGEPLLSAAHEPPPDSRPARSSASPRGGAKRPRRSSGAQSGSSV